MNDDAFLEFWDADYEALKREYRAKGFSGESHDMVVSRSAQRWRLIQGAEPSRFLSGDTPAVHMRYGPYM